VCFAGQKDETSPKTGEVFLFLHKKGVTFAFSVSDSKG